MMFTARQDSPSARKFTGESLRSARWLSDDVTPKSRGRKVLNQPDVWNARAVGCNLTPQQATSPFWHFRLHDWHTADVDWRNP